MIEFKNYSILQYSFTLDIDQNENTIIYNPSINVLKKLGLEISGINKSEGITYNGYNIYDNKRYFENRIYIDCNNKYLNTLLYKNVASAMESNYNIIIDTNKFQTIVKNAQIRSCGHLNSDYTFTQEGIALSDIALALSIYRYHILLTPLENIINTYHLDTIKEEIKKSNSLLLVTKLTKYKNISKRIIVLGFKKVFDLQSDSIIYIIKKVNQDILINEFDLSNNIIYQSTKSDLTIIDSKVPIDILKKINTKSKILKDELINIDIYIKGDNYENED